MDRITSLGLALAIVAFVAGSATGTWGEETQRGPSRVVDGAKQVGRGVEETAKGIGATVTERAKKAGEDAKPIGDELHDRAKGFGNALWDGMKYVGRTVRNFFTGGK